MVCALAACIAGGSVHAWNAIGHQVIMQIALDNMTEEAKKVSDYYNHALDVVYPPLSMVEASIWLDTIHYQGNVIWYNRMHYVNWGFSKDGTPIPAIESTNAVWAIDEALKNISSKYATRFDRGISWRILIHVAGDIHQPLHAGGLVSKEHPNGDLGGNLFPINASPIAKNLHSYWDKGGGYLVTKTRYKEDAIEKIAHEIEAQWPCDMPKMDVHPRYWLKESHKLAVNTVYNITPNSKPDALYQAQAINVSKQRMALAGCRLAAILNRLTTK